MSVTADAPATVATARRAGRVAAWRREIGTPATCAAGVIVLLMSVALLAPVLAPHDPAAVDLSQAYAGPSGDHLLGADGSGRDLLSRLIWGSRTALLGPMALVLIATVVGAAIALVSAWLGGPFDSVISRVLDIVFAFPAVLLALVVAAMFGPGLTAAVIALAIAYVPYVARITRSEAIRQRHMAYIQAGELQGLSGWVIARRHLLPNVMPLIVAQMTVSFGYAMVDLAALSYLGVGVQAPTADWGAMVASGQQGVIQGRPAESLWAGGLVVVVVVAAMLLGDRVGARDPELTR
ncbi:MAG TPA: ABC transporter permease [Baekduia sp.]|uniref:ABC transporter permease n=1 Tax=Baekduia sp. TaxID=2600305 RepID=UPI002D78DFE7|nr:ABC transporter permease [Baekduia sp.]HET6509099.1 ABC transporter permease [Baekduia sp.]